LSFSSGCKAFFWEEGSCGQRLDCLPLTRVWSADAKTMLCGFVTSVLGLPLLAPLSLSLSLSLSYISPIYIYIYISYMHRNIYKRDVLVCLFYSRNRFPNITILWRLIKKGPQRDFRLSIILSFYFFLDELFYLFCTLVFHPFHQPIYSPSLKIRLSTARGKQVVYKQLAWFLL
jgi:hypothetical protein